MEQWKKIFEAGIADSDYDINYDKEGKGFRTRFVDQVLENPGAMREVYSQINWIAVMSETHDINTGARVLEGASYCTPVDPMAEEVGYFTKRLPDAMNSAGLVVSRAIVAFIRAEFDTLLEWHREEIGVTKFKEESE